MRAGSAVLLGSQLTVSCVMVKWMQVNESEVDRLLTPSFVSTELIERPNFLWISEVICII